MRIAIGELWQETNSFAPIQTTKDDFDFTSGSDMIAEYKGSESEIGGFIDICEDSHNEVDIVPIFSARAMPGGPVSNDLFEIYLNKFKKETHDKTLDGILLSFHGSMVTGEQDDPEGEFLDGLRSVVGDIPIVASLDHHGNVTKKMVDEASGFVAYRTHPHTDVYETGQQAAKLILDINQDLIEPVMTMAKAPMILSTGFETDQEPMRRLFKRAQTLEKTNSDVISVSCFPVHPWLDVPDMGFTALAVTDGNVEKGEEIVTNLVKMAWDAREEFKRDYMSIEKSLKSIVEYNKDLVVLSDMGDGTLAGAPGDSNIILTELLERTDASHLSAAIPIRDPEAVQQLTSARDDIQNVAVGGKFTPIFDPTEVCLEVVEVFETPFTLEGSYYAGKKVDMGTRVLAQVIDRPISLLLSEKTGMTTDPSFFSVHNIDPTEMDILVVKSTLSFRPNFEPIASTIINVDTPGSCPINLSQLDYKKAHSVYPIEDICSDFPIRGITYTGE